MFDVQFRRLLRLRCEDIAIARNGQGTDDIEDWLCLINEYQRLIDRRLERIEARLDELQEERER